ncbi:MAG: DNA primase [Filifactor alocis]|nr:DNA primase [Filifactor alocis]
MNFDSDFLQEIKEKNDIVDVISDYVQLKGSYGRFTGLCPFHNEKTPSFSVNESGQFYKCFGCHAGGDVIKFIQEIEKVDFPEAVKILARRAMIPLPEEKTLTLKEIEDRKKREELFEINLEAAKFYREALFNDHRAKEYLSKRKLQRDIILRFGLGYAPLGNKLLFFLQKKYSRELLVQSGLFIVKEGSELKDKFKNRLIFPIFNDKGRVIAFGGRALDDSFGPKYLNSPETVLFSKKHNLYAYQIAKKHLEENSIILSEGYMDTIMLHQFGFSNTVASLGTAFTVEQAALLKKRKVQNVFIAYDSDQAGRGATNKAMDLIFREGLNPLAVIFTDSKDPDDYLKKFGVKKFKECMENALNIISFKIFILKEKFNLEYEVDRLNYIREAIQILKFYEDKLQNSHLIIEKTLIDLSQETGFSIKALGQEMYGKYFSMKQFSSLPLQENKVKKTEVKEIDRDSHILRREKRLLDIIKEDRDLIDRYHISVADFFIEENRRAFEQIISDDSKKRSEQNLIQHDESEEYIDELVGSIRKENLRIQIRKLKEEQSKMSNSSKNSSKYIELSLKIVELQKRLK